MTNSTVKIWTNKPELLGIPECVPRSASEFFPKWWDETSTRNITGDSLLEKINPNKTIKMCPGIYEFMSEGIVIPMWCDSYLSVENGMIKIVTSSTEYPSWTTHSDSQFLNHSPAWVKDEIKAVFKTLCPWFIKTPPGYSVYQMPLFYHFDRNFTVLPGSIQTDSNYQINQQVLFHGKETEIFIKRGTPLAVYIPYKRESLKYEVMAETDIENQDRIISAAKVNTKFYGGYRETTEPVCPMRNKE